MAPNIGASELHMFLGRRVRAEYDQAPEQLVDRLTDEAEERVRIGGSKDVMEIEIRLTLVQEVAALL